MQNIKDFFQGASNSIASNVSAPVDGLAWLLRKAGVPMPANPMGGSDWMNERGLTPQPQSRTAGLLGEFAGMAGPMVAATKAPQLAKGLLQMGDNLAAPRTLNPQTGAVVWHGSPHKFDKFDSAKIGTGEGAQAYGHGLYLADSPDVAKGYKSMRAPGMTTQARQDGSGLHDLYEDVGAETVKWSKVASGKNANELINKQKESYGSLYKVDLPDEQIAKMLDWDKPLSGQHADVKTTLNGIMSSEAPDFWKAFKLNDRTGGVAQNEIAKRYGVPSNELSLRGGQGALRAIEDVLGKSNSASDLLRAKGIPGIRYLDGGSRATGGTSNYVVFPGNEGLLNILERNGKPNKGRKIDFEISESMRRYPAQQVNPEASKPFVYPQDKALATAQLNAAKSLDDGGLGLLANNTPAQRAQAMGFNTDAWHGTNKTNIKSLNRSKTGAQGPGVYLGDDAMVANAYSGDGKGANVIPALLRGKYVGNMEFSKEVGTHGWGGVEDALKASGKSGIHDTMFESAYNVFDPKNIRSRFAAFDPARRNEADILGRADPELLKLIAGGLLGYGGYNAMRD